MQYLDLFARQCHANQLLGFLALSDSVAWSGGPDGICIEPGQPPFGGVIVTAKLESCEVFEPTPDLLARRARLDRFAASLGPGGYMFGDLTKGGHRAAPEERDALAGLQSNGVPTGLDQCLECGEWCGTCLDPNPEFAGMVVSVHCRCDNHNLCARCGERLADRRLNANFYNERDGNIWHVPGFSGLSHRCSDLEVPSGLSIPLAGA